MTTNLSSLVVTFAGQPLFPDDEYGLLNAAKFAVHELTWNDSDGAANATLGAELVSAYPSRYSQLEIVVLALIMTAMMVLIVVGNMLVVIAIFTENNLTGVQNWFIASLAVADTFIGLVIMPFSLSYELMGYWMFGQLWCEIHAAMDVLLCTSSIMNICLISLDRYWSITRAIDYLNARTPLKVALMIITVWILSGLISIPPLLGWKEVRDMQWFQDLLAERGNRSQMEYLEYLDTSGRMSLTNFTETLETVVYPQCGLSQDVGYVLYSAFGSFYIPSCIMVFVYIKIYYAARERARRNLMAKRKSRRKSARAQAAAAERTRLQQQQALQAQQQSAAAAAAAAASTGRQSLQPESGMPMAPSSAPPTLAQRPSPGSTNGNNNVVSGGAASGLSPGDGALKSPRQSALKRTSLDSAAALKAEKKTRFSFADDEVARDREQKEQRARLLEPEASSCCKDDDDYDDDDFDDSDLSDDFESRYASSAEASGELPEKASPVPPAGPARPARPAQPSQAPEAGSGLQQPRKKLVHILSAVSVSVNDSPLSLGDETSEGASSSLCAENSPISAVSMMTPVPQASPSSHRHHAYGACLANGMRSRRSIGVSTRPDDDSDDARAAGGNGSCSTSDSGAKMRCIRLRSKFRAPLYSRRPSKETREMIDTGKSSRKERGEDTCSASTSTTFSLKRLRRKHKKRSKSDANGGETSKTLTTTTTTATANATTTATTTTPRVLFSKFTLNRFRKKKPVAGINGATGLPQGTGFGRLDKKKEMSASEAEREKKRVARKKERRATLILGLIMGSFIACWLPFFFLYSISPVCPICEEQPDSPCCVKGWGFSFAFWLGYSNSALNPVIYTIFNKDFRRAFKRILFK